jgi:hypothetical protein
MTSCGRRRTSFPLLVVCLLAAAPLRGQAPQPAQPAPAPAAPQNATVPPPLPPNPGDAAAPAGTAPADQPQAGTEPTNTIGGLEPVKPLEDRLLPKLDVYFPEGDLDLRVNRLFNKTFFEGQVKYNFINGDITAFLRYRYYGYNRTTQFTVFDAITFDRIGQNITQDFDRVRGTLLLMEWPHSYNSRSFLLTELDRISTNRGENGSDFFVRRDRTDTFVRVGYQLGTPDEGRSSAIVGETRARTERLFSAFREFGPGESTITAALTDGFPYGIGDFDYTKFEFEALKRFDVSERTFLIGRVRGGTFLHVAKAPVSTLPPSPLPIDFYSVPTSEAFDLSGRENLKGLNSSDTQLGTQLLFTTWEYFFPWFLESHHSFLHIDWQNWYWVLYAGYGTVGLDRKIYTEFSTYIPDTGVGFESSFSFRKYKFFVSGVVAQALKGNGGLEARFSVKSYR